MTHDGGTTEDVASTRYCFGCFRDPVVRLGGGNKDNGGAKVVLKSMGPSNRSVVFKSARQGRFEWRYGSKRERAAVAVGKEVDSLLILECVAKDHGGMESRVRVAQLVKGERTRTAGTKKSTAGNGGLLEMDLRGARELGKNVEGWLLRHV